MFLMQMLKYRQFLDESEKEKLRDIFIEMRAKEIFKNLSLYDFMTDKYQKKAKDINLIADSLKIKNFFPSFDMESPNAELLVFYKWIVLNEKIKFDGQIKLLKKGASKEKDEQKKDAISKRIADQTEFFDNCTERLFCNFAERGKKDAVEYSPDEAVTLYRELIRLMQCGRSLKSYYIPYSEIADMKIPKIDVDPPISRLLVEQVTGTIMLGNTGGGVLRSRAVRKEYRIKSKEMLEYLNLMNLLLKVCIGKYYTEEEKKDACFV